MISHIDQYAILHESDIYGNSSIMYIDTIRELFKQFPHDTILDYGCGQSILANYLGKEFNIPYYKYDPAIPRFSEFPVTYVDFTLCIDVLEHIPLEWLDMALLEIKVTCTHCFFVIDQGKAIWHLPNGENCHCTLMTEQQWFGVLSEYFHLQKLPSPKAKLICMGTSKENT